ncbi:DNA processing protein DprA [Pseudobutyrivibrio sp. LB2011]|uniref:DNA processing protein DprA n=1 Tax=Pseudobutyrivibrio sp. LB2011 TaxID=1408312 RepID=UPI000679AC6F|nr:DNA processing protein DprA [Pseudobutyrivibrio sp. LB2011]
MSEIKTITRNQLTLYYLGDISLLDKDIVAVIGKREINSNERIIAKNTGRFLARHGYVVLNGLALGTDKAALEGAIEEHGKTIVIMAGGLDSIYPKSCTNLAFDILNNGGCIISTYPIGTKPNKIRFVERDSLQAELASKVCVVTCEKEGGTMHTIKAAYKCQKPIGVICKSTGNEFAIREMKAIQLNNFKELLDFVKANSSNGVFQQLELADFMTEPINNSKAPF